MSKLLPRTDDLVFKKIFGDHKHDKILKDFLQSILDLPEEEYEEIQIADPHSKVSALDDKECILDIKLYTKTGKVLNIEMQVRNSPVMRRRIVYYLSDMVKGQLKTGDSYDKLQKVISIVIAAKHNLIASDKVYFHTYYLYDKNNDIILTDLLEVDTLELPKLPKKSDNSKLWKWLRFLKTDSEEEIEMLIDGNSAMKEAVCVLKELSEDERTRMLVQSREKYRQDQEAREKEKFQKGVQKGREEGIEEGMVQGERNKAIAVAKSALKMGLRSEQISDLTGLTAQEIEALR